MGNNKTKLKRLFVVERKRMVEEKKRMVAQINAKAFVTQER
jgi:hypothetical protein